MNKIYFHGSNTYLSVNTILVPQTDTYENAWGLTDFYQSLELYRPSHMLAHKNAVFMCDNEDDIDNSGGGTEWIFGVKPLGIINKHDLNWGSEISCLSDNIILNKDNIKIAAEKYWSGIPHHDENVWEYLTPSARILSVEKF